MPKSTRKRTRRKSFWTVKGHRIEKPFADFPLSPHALGYWVKKIQGRMYKFGRWARLTKDPVTDRQVPVRVPDDQWDRSWQDALRKYKNESPYIKAGRKPPESQHGSDVGPTVKALCDEFIKSKERKQDAGEIGQRSVTEYEEIARIIRAEFGDGRLVDDLRPADFGALRARMAKRWGPVRMCNSITRVKSIFKYADDNELIERKVRYGSEFDKPDKAVLRKHRAETGERMFDADTIHKLLAAATPTMKAMILLGVNCGFGNTDCAELPMSALKLDTGWVRFPRPKTGIERRCPLWPETVAAIRDAIADRPAPRGGKTEGLVFLTRLGRSHANATEKSHTNNVTHAFTKLLRKVSVHKERIGFYALRHTFRTIADDTRDHVAINLIMGHTDPTIAEVYRERIEDDRLVAVTERVRHWLFGKAATEGKHVEASA